MSHLKSFRGLGEKVGGLFKFGQDIVWMNVFGITLLHFTALIGLLFFRSTFTFSWHSLFYAVLMGYFAGFGISAGVHRFWSHRSYKAKLPLRIFLMICFTMAGQYSLVRWVHDHRMHHKYSDTNSDPHNSSRGFFYCHCGWLFLRRHPELRAKYHEIDVSDILADPVVAFHQKFYLPLVILCVIIPSVIPYFAWNEPLSNVFFLHLCLRYVIMLNLTWCINSVNHFFGTRAFNSKIRPVNNIPMLFLTMGEGYHNYHHVFPMDYRGAPGDTFPNVTKYWLDLFAKFELAYDLKAVSNETIQRALANNKIRDMKELHPDLVEFVKK